MQLTSQSLKSQDDPFNSGVHSLEGMLILINPGSLIQMPGLWNIMMLSLCCLKQLSLNDLLEQL